MRYVLILLVLIFANVASAMDCDVAPTCEELGYSKADDLYCTENGYMYCPLDHTYKKCVNMDCAKLGFTESDKTSWCGKLAKCKGNPQMTLCQNLCEIGDVYYSDGTCGYVEDYDSSHKNKIPVGVVYYVTDNGRHGKVINLHDLGRSSASSKFDPTQPYNTNYVDFEWGSYGSNIPSLTDWNSVNCADVAKKGDHTDPFWSSGMYYTKVIADFQNNNLEYPAPTALAFYPPNIDKDDPIVGQGKWYLPTLGELMDLYGYNYSQVNKCIGAAGVNSNTKKAVNATLTTLKNKGVTAKTFTNDYYWSSLECDDNFSWGLNMTSGYRNYDYKSDNHSSDYVRVSLEF